MTKLAKKVLTTFWKPTLLNSTSTWTGHLATTPYRSRRQINYLYLFLNNAALGVSERNPVITDTAVTCKSEMRRSTNWKWHKSLRFIWESINQSSISFAVAVELKAPLSTMKDDTQYDHSLEKKQTTEQTLTLWSAPVHSYFGTSVVQQGPVPLCLFEELEYVKKPSLKLSSNTEQQWK